LTTTGQGKPEGVDKIKPGIVTPESSDAIKSKPQLLYDQQPDAQNATAETLAAKAKADAVRAMEPAKAMVKPDPPQPDPNKPHL
jgi:hypothetical protein